MEFRRPWWIAQWKHCLNDIYLFSCSNFLISKFKTIWNEFCPWDSDESIPTGQIEVKKTKKYPCAHSSHPTLASSASSSSCLGMRPSQVAVCTCLVLSSLFNHPSSRHKIQDFLSGTSYTAQYPSHLSVFSSGVWLSQCVSCYNSSGSFLSCQPEPAVIYPSETWSLTQAGVCSVVVPLELELIALGKVWADRDEVGEVW